jgi:hypothetical protein
MGTTLKPMYANPKIELIERSTAWDLFIAWCNSQEKNRFGWLAGALAGHGCILTPITLFAIILSGNLFIFWILAIVAMAMCLITNLAALPTKITIPVFFASILIDIAIIVYCVSIGFDISGTTI